MTVTDDVATLLSVCSLSEAELKARIDADPEDVHRALSYLVAMGRVVLDLRATGEGPKRWTLSSGRRSDR